MHCEPLHHLAYYTNRPHSIIEPSVSGAQLRPVQEGNGASFSTTRQLLHITLLTHAGKTVDTYMRMCRIKDPKADFDTGGVCLASSFQVNSNGARATGLFMGSAHLCVTTLAALCPQRSTHRESSFASESRRAVSSSSGTTNVRPVMRSSKPASTVSHAHFDAHQHASPKFVKQTWRTPTAVRCA